jgi:hypothetical protein
VGRLFFYYLTSLERRPQMKQRILLTMVTCVLVTQLALADEGQQPWNRHKGFYAEGNVGTNIYYLGVVSSGYDAASSGLEGFAWNVAGGYGFTTHHAVEGGFMQNYADFDVGTTAVPLVVSTNVNVVYLAWRGTLPIKDRFALFGKLGAMVLTHPKSDKWMALPYTGLGVSYAVTPKIDISVQYQGAVYVVAGAGALTVGATYHF